MNNLILVQRGCTSEWVFDTAYYASNPHDMDTTKLQLSQHDNMTMQQDAPKCLLLMDDNKVMCYCPIYNHAITSYRDPLYDFLFSAIFSL